MENKEIRYQDKPIFDLNTVIEDKFKRNYNKVLKNIFSSLSKQILKFSKDV